MTVRRRLSVPVLTVVGCLATGALAACTAKTEAVAADYESELRDVVGISELDDGWTTFEDPQGRLVMPGVTVAVDRVKRADSLSAEECEVLDCELPPDQEGAEIEAADGHDLLAVVFRAPERATPPTSGSSGKLTVGTDTVRYDLPLEFPDLNLGQAKALILSVPDDSGDAEVTATGADQVARLSLSTGELADDEASQQAAGYLDVRPDPVSPQAHRAVGTMRARTDRGPVDFRLRIDWALTGQIERTPYLPQLGWAEPGRAWLTMGQATPTLQRDWDSDVNVDDYELDHRETFTVTPDGGKPIPAAPGTSLVGSYYGAAGIMPVWNVPADLTSGTITIDPSGEIDIDIWRGDEYPEVRSVDWARGKAPEPLEIEFDLSPDEG